MPLTDSRKVAVVATFSSLTLATNYALAVFPNIKLFDTIVFLSAFLFGLDVGLAVAVLSWVVYGSVNPWGTASLYLISILAVSETVYAVFGWIARRTSTSQRKRIASRSLLFGVLGLIGAFLYDLITNVATAYLTKTDLLFTLAFGVPFALAHELSNFVFFSTVAPLLIAGVGRVVPGWLASGIRELIAR